MLINVYVASPDPDLNPRGGGQLPNPNECNSTLTSETGDIYPHCYIDVDERGHRLRAESPVTNLPRAPARHLRLRFPILMIKVEVVCLLIHKLS